MQALTLFDTTAGDAFTALNWSGTDASLTVGASQVNQNSASVLNIRGSVKRSGAVINHALEFWTMIATIQTVSWPSASRGLYVGMNNSVSGFFGGELARHGGSALLNLYDTRLNSSLLAYDGGGGYSIAGSPTAVITISRKGDVLESKVNYAATGDRTANLTMVGAATSYELPRMFSDFSLNFGTGELNVLSLKVTADFANARFAFIGDSLTRAAKATNYSEGFAQLIRADYPTDTLIAGASSAMSADWLANIESVKMMTPRRVFIELGTNDFINAVPFATYQSNMTAIIAALESVGCSVVLMSLPPLGNATVRTVWNAWLAGLGKPYIDIYAPLATGDALNASYNSGDAVHWNTAGHAVVYDTIKAAIVANGW